MRNTKHWYNKETKQHRAWTYSLKSRQTNNRKLITIQTTKGLKAKSDKNTDKLHTKSKCGGFLCFWRYFY
jgi:hypothetical protein